MQGTDGLIGIDLGGTKIEAAVLDGGHRVTWRERVPTPSGDYPATLDALQGLVARIEAETGCRGPVGMATPGAVSRRSGRMKNCNSTCLIDRPLREDLEQRIGRPVRIANDADCLALSESVDGAAAGHGSVFAVILGTGVGAGITVGGHLLGGPNAIAGEWGHNPLPEAVRDPGDTRTCYCGRANCVETFVSGPGLERSWTLLGGAPLRVPGIDARRRQGDPLAERVLAAHHRQLAAALAVVINILDPEIVVFAGGLSNLPGLVAGVRAQLAPFVFSDTVETALTTALHGDSSGIRGAAWLWQEGPPGAK